METHNRVSASVTTKDADGTGLQSGSRRRSKSFSVATIAMLFLASASLAQEVHELDSTIPTERHSIGNANSATCTHLSELLLFIAQAADFSVLENCPSIRSADPGSLMSSVAFTTPAAQRQPEAVYLPGKNVILTRSDIDLDGVIGRGLLVHELVHAHQFQTGAAERAPCVGALEAEAYRVQSEYLGRQGFLDQALAVRFFGLVIGSCGHAYHPDF